MKPTKKAIQLLEDTFNFTDKHGRLNRAAFSGSATDEGSASLWGQLVLAGFVEWAKYPSPLGHRFSVVLTDAGAAFLKGTH